MVHRQEAPGFDPVSFSLLQCYSLFLYIIYFVFILFSLFSVIPHIHRGSGIHKEFDILRMMRYIAAGPVSPEWQISSTTSAFAFPVIRKITRRAVKIGNPVIAIRFCPLRG